MTPYLASKEPIFCVARQRGLPLLPISTLSLNFFARYLGRWKYNRGR